LNEALERFVLVNANKVRDALDETLAF